MYSSTTTISKKEVLQFMSDLQQRGSFGQEAYATIDQMVGQLAQLKSNGAISDEDLKEIRHFFGQDFLENTLHGMALMKKYGYAGDFLMIDRIYTGNQTSHPFFNSWDQYFQNHAAPKAVRNRKSYFKQLAHRKLQDQQEMRLLNVASGPGRDLLELYMEKDITNHLQTVCVEMDSHAIRYAKSLTADYAAHIRFINKNIFKFDTEEQFDIIWSAGLFDYFDDKAFVYVLSKFKKWLSPKGEIVIGNFNQQHNPTRAYMELFGDWHLHHRSRQELITLGLEAGFDEQQLSVGHEDEGVNLFLHIKVG